MTKWIIGGIVVLALLYWLYSSNQTAKPVAPINPSAGAQSTGNQNLSKG